MWQAAPLIVCNYHLQIIIKSSSSYHQIIIKLSSSYHQIIIFNQRALSSSLWHAASSPSLELPLPSLTPSALHSLPLVTNTYNNVKLTHSAEIQIHFAGNAN